MAIIPAHQKPTSKTDCVDTWKDRGRIPVPTKSGTIMDLVIVNLYETTAVNDLYLDLLVEARATKRAPLKRFGVLFADTAPPKQYPIPILWVKDGVSAWVV